MDDIKCYSVNHGNNLTKCQIPCVLYLRNSNTYHWYEGWAPPEQKNEIPWKLGKYVEEHQKEE